MDLSDAERKLKEGEDVLVSDSERKLCDHCGTRFKSRDKDDRFCCSGCEYVYGLVHDEDLTRFYELGGEDIQPVGSSVFSRVNWDWLEELKNEKEDVKNEVAISEFGLAGISCVGCVWLIDRIFEQYAGGVSCRVDAHRGEVELSWRSGTFDLIGFARKLHHFGYSLTPASEKKRSETSQLTWRVGLCGAFGLNSMLYTLPTYLGMEPGFLFAKHFDWLSIVFATASMIVGGGYFIKRAGKALLNGIIHIDLPISIGICAAYGISWYGYAVADRNLFYFDFVSTFAFLMLVGRWLQVYSVERNRIKAQARDFQEPKVRRKTESGGWANVVASELKEGDEYILEVDAITPVASSLVSRNACFSLDWINGESDARPFARQAKVPSGAICRGSEAICLRANEKWEASLLRRLTTHRDGKREIDRVAQKWIARYLLIVLVVGALSFCIWNINTDLERALGVLVATLVVSCPCGIGIALPLADDLINGGLRLRGVFTRSWSLWNRLLGIRSIVFDKTGTLTKQRLSILNSDSLGELSDHSLSILSNLVSISTHPISTAIREKLLARRWFDPFENLVAYEEVGYGMLLSEDGVEWKLGKPSWAVNGATGDGVVFSKGGVEIARIFFREEAKSDALEEIEALEEMGFKLYVLSGDDTQRVKRIAEVAGINPRSAYGDLNPTQKSEWIVNHGSSKTLMIGDGANDSFALDTAGVSGAPASDNALLSNKADFYFLGQEISGVRAIIEASKTRRRAIRRTLGFAIAYNVVAASCAVAGIVTPLIAAVLMPLSSIASLGIVWKSARLKS